jgi:hypothetical protein
MSEETDSQQRPDLPDLPDELFTEIGRVTVFFNRLESVLRLFISSVLVGDEITKQVAVRGDSFPDLIAKLRHILAARDLEADLRSELDVWLRSVESANRLRRETVHSRWIGLPGGKEAMALLHGKRETIYGGFLSAENVAARAQVIAAVGIYGMELLQKVRESMPDLPTD